MSHSEKIVRRINRFFPVFFGGVFFIVAIPVITYYSYAQELESKIAIMNERDTGLTLLDREGNPFFSFYEAKSKEEIPIASIPKHLQEAVIAIEDKDFYKHEGYSIPAITRSAFSNIVSRKLAYGGSTITQQLVKNALLSPQKKFLRKYQELVLAQELERRYSKQEILEMYLNSVYFGEGAFGVEEAAITYFNKKASQLTLAESALLVGLLPAPSQLSPLSGNLENSKIRQQLVLEKMVQQDYISVKQKENALQTKLTFNTNPKELNTFAPHFALYVRDELIDAYGEQEVIQAGLRVKTTLHREWQLYAEETLKNQIDSLRNLQVSNGGAVAIDAHSGEIYVMVGSADWNNNKNGKVNIATVPQQPGSSFKPIVYATAFDEGIITPASILKDTKTTFVQNYTPQNYDRKFRGRVTVRRALANSLNIPAVEVITKLGVENALTKAKEFGLRSLKEPVNYGPSLALGAGEVSLIEMTNAYATLADYGKYKKPTAILQIENKFGEVLFKHKIKTKQVIKPESAFMISSILSDSRARAEAFGASLNTSKKAAVKTGTTDEYRDAWTLGYTPNIAVGVWVGNNDNSSMDSVPGSLGGAPIWRSLIEYYAAEDTITTFEQPDGIVAVQMCGYTEYFIEGTQTYVNCKPKEDKEKEEKDKKEKDDNSQEARLIQ